MDSGSEIDSFILGIAIYTTAGPGYYPFLGHATLQVEPADLHKKLMPTPRHTEPSNFFWLHTPQIHLLIN